MGDQQLKAWFNAIDVDHSGRLDSKELQRALAMGNLHYGLNDVVRTQKRLHPQSVNTKHLQPLAAELLATCMSSSCCLFSHAQLLQTCSAQTLVPYHQTQAG